MPTTCRPRPHTPALLSAASDLACILGEKASQVRGFLAPVVITCLQPTFLTALLLQHAPAFSRLLRFGPRSFYTGVWGGRPISAIGIAESAPMAATLIEQAAFLGARELVVLGYGGSLVEHVRPGDVVVARAAFRGEGTSAHYVRGGRLIGGDDTLGSGLVNHLRGQGLRVQEGLIWTTDAPYRETVRNVAAYVSRGALAVEMEVSAIYAVSLFHGLSVTAVVVICDTLAGGKWHLGVDAPEFTAALKAASAAAFDFGLVRSGILGCR